MISIEPPFVHSPRCLQGIVVNQAFPSFHEGSLEITLEVPLLSKPKCIARKSVNKCVLLIAHKSVNKCVLLILETFDISTRSFFPIENRTFFWDFDCSTIQFCFNVYWIPKTKTQPIKRKPCISDYKH